MRRGNVKRGQRERVEDLESCSIEDWSDVVTSPRTPAATRN